MVANITECHKAMCTAMRVNELNFQNYLLYQLLSYMPNCTLHLFFFSCKSDPIDGKAAASPSDGKSDSNDGKTEQWWAWAWV